MRPLSLENILRRLPVAAAAAAMFVTASTTAIGQSGTPAKASQASPATTQPPKTAKPANKPAAKLSDPIKPNRILIDINHASLTELKQIPGIGDVMGKKIIAGRPYANKTQLVSRKIINADLYETIQGMVIAKQ